MSALQYSYVLLDVPYRLTNELLGLVCGDVGCLRWAPQGNRHPGGPKLSRPHKRKSQLRVCRSHNAGYPAEYELRLR